MAMGMDMSPIVPAAPNTLPAISFSTFFWRMVRKQIAARFLFIRSFIYLFSSTDCFLSVESGKEIVLSYDASPLKMIRTAVNVHRIQSLQIYEKLLGADTLELGHVDYSFKPVKPIVGTEQTVLEQTLMVTHPPLFYGAMPNLGLTRENALILALPNNLEVAHSHIRASQTVPHHFHDARRLRSDGAP